MRTRCSTWWALTRTFVALASIAALQLTGSLHYVLIEHVRCAEHGELTHAQAHHASSVVVHAFDAVQSVASERDSHGHEHCPLATERRPEMAVLPSAWSLYAPDVDDVHVLESGSQAVYATPLVHAPKTSPPV